MWMWNYRAGLCSGNSYPGGDWFECRPEHRLLWPDPPGKCPDFNMTSSILSLSDSWFISHPPINAVQDVKKKGYSLHRGAVLERARNSQWTPCPEISPAKKWASFWDFSVLRKVEEDPWTSVGKIAAADGIDVSLVWRTIHEQSCKSGVSPMASHKIRCKHIVCS
jgi:hypothetical protein